MKNENGVVVGLWTQGFDESPLSLERTPYSHFASSSGVSSSSSSSSYPIRIVLVLRASTSTSLVAPAASSSLTSIVILIAAAIAAVIAMTVVPFVASLLLVLLASEGARAGDDCVRLVTLRANMRVGRTPILAEVALTLTGAVSSQMKARAQFGLHILRLLTAEPSLLADLRGEVGAVLLILRPRLGDLLRLLLLLGGLPLLWRGRPDPGQPRAVAYHAEPR